MPNSSLHPKLAHLSDSQITDLITRYYAGAGIADLLAEYAIDCHPPQLYKLFPPVIHSSAACPNCGAVMMLKHVARSVGMADSKTLHCSQCRHETSFRCKCDYCRNRGKIKNGRFSHTPFSNQTFEAQGVTSQVLKPDHLTLEQAIALLALARCEMV